MLAQGDRVQGGSSGLPEASRPGEVACVRDRHGVTSSATRVNIEEYAYVVPTRSTLRLMIKIDLSYVHQSSCDAPTPVTQKMTDEQVKAIVGSPGSLDILFSREDSELLVNANKSTLFSTSEKSPNPACVGSCDASGTAGGEQGRLVGACGVQGFQVDTWP